MWHGRDEEHRVLADTLASARTGRGRVLIIHGAAGVGKTTLLDHALAHADDMTVLRGAAVESEVELPYAGLELLLRPIFGLLDELPRVQAGALRTAFGYAEGTAERFVVAVATLALLALAAQQRPVVVVADDAHWLDQATVDTLLFVGRRLRAEPVALLIAARETFPGHGLPELGLGGLDPVASDRLLTERFGELSARVREQLITDTGGNPLALVELAGQLSVAQRRGTEPLPDHIPLGKRLLRAYTERADQLPATTRLAVLVVAADDTGGLDTVLAAARRLGVSPTALTAAEQADIIAVDGMTLRFRHPLIRSAVYQHAPFAERMTVHRALADALAEAGRADHAVWHRALASVGPDEPTAAALEDMASPMLRRGGAIAVSTALHRAAMLSGDPVDRARRLTRSAWAAWQAGHPDRARGLVEQADELPADQDTRTELTCLRAYVDLETGSPSAACVQALHAARLAATNDPGRAVRMVLTATVAAYHAGDVARISSALAGVSDLAHGTPYELAARCASILSGGDVTGVCATPDELRITAETLFAVDDPHVWSWPLLLALFAGNDILAHRFGHQAAGRLRSAGMAGILTGLAPLLSTVEYHIGRWTDAAALASEGVALCRETGQVNRAADLRAYLALIAAGTGDADECRRLADDALARGIAVTAALAVWARGLLALSLGDADEAYHEFARIFAPTSRYAHPYYRRTTAVDFIEACVRNDRRAQAEAVFAGFEAWADTAGVSWARHHLYRCRALLAPDEEAEPHFRDALAERDDRPFDHARTSLLFGEWLRRNRRRTEARSHLRTAHEILDGLGATRWATTARTQLRAAGGQTRRTTPTARLTPQELQIAQLAATGMSNREIATQLFLSPRTVGYHLGKIFPKLGITARGQLRDVPLG
ncbi:helix-turn-helix transcriptional regulator [Actinocrispum wychmicini]|uniref:Regulatory LuxR family protein n=1 Tax=Actinocrispum wychmicini TaxID=1213861 RepID=A0A4R2JC06_9PSEU|nr:LuxR family transcriptional regulator [Actinocrispum wychmicini]TCO55937.1 regulatory LuxR family protein [Actinocrispum wychmicini]